jgi:MraZ protein
LLLGYASELELDSNGRVLLPPSLRKYAQLDKKLVLVGQGKKFELWSEDNWQQCLETAVSGDFELPDAIATISF